MTHNITLIFSAILIIKNGFLLHGQVLHNPQSIASVITSSSTFQDSIIQVTGRIVLKKEYEAQVDGFPYAKIEISDGTDTIGVITSYPLLRVGDSVSVAGVYLPERSVGRFVVATNEIDARKGYVDVHKGGYEAMMGDISSMSVPVMQVDTPESLTLYWISLLGFVVAVVSIVPIIFRSRRFNIETAISLEREPRHIVDNGVEYISFAVRLNKLSAMSPMISEDLKLKVGGQFFHLDRVLDDRGERIKFPMELERSQSMEIQVSAGRMLKHLSQYDMLTLTLRDEYCSRKFQKKMNVNFIASSTPLPSTTD